jgi:hypothetical protein
VGDEARCPHALRWDKALGHTLPLRKNVSFLGSLAFVCCLLKLLNFVMFLYTSYADICALFDSVYVSMYKEIGKFHQIATIYKRNKNLSEVY